MNEAVVSVTSYIINVLMAGLILTTAMIFIPVAYEMTREYLKEIRKQNNQ